MKIFIICAALCLAWSAQAKMLLQRECINKFLDVYFIADISKSIKRDEISIQNQIISDTIQAMHINPIRTRVGLITYGRTAQEVFSLTKYKTAAELQGKTLVTRPAKVKAQSNLNLALELVLKRFAAQKRKNVPQVVVILSDGRQTSQENTHIAVNKIKKNTDITIVTLAVGSDADKDELLRISSGTVANENTFWVDIFLDWRYFKSNFAKHICIAPTTKNRAQCKTPCFKYGQYKSFNQHYFAGESVFFWCNRGLPTSGNRIATCKSDGTWTSPPPVCDKGKYDSYCTPKCDTLENGFYLNNGVNYGSKIYYMCNEGYKLEGLAQQTCVLEKGWGPKGTTKCVSKITPSCVNKTIDVFIMVDTSRSTGDRNMDRMRKYVAKVLDSFDYKNMRVGIITFNNEAKIEVPLSGSNPHKGTNYFIQRKSKEFHIRLDKAFDLLLSSFPDKSRTRKAFVILNKKTTNKAALAISAKKAHDAGIEVAVMGITNRLDTSELITAASGYLVDNVLMVDNHKDLDKMSGSKSSNLICQEYKSSPYGSDELVVLSSQQVKKGKLTAFTVETRSAGKAYLQVFRKDGDQNVNLFYRYLVNFTSAGKQTVNVPGCNVQDGDIIGFTSIGATPIKFSDSCTENKSVKILIKKNPGSNLETGSTVSIGSMFTLTCRKYELTPVVSDGALQTRNYGFGAGAETTLDYTTNGFVIAQTPIYTRPGRLVGFNFYARNTGRITFIVYTKVSKYNYNSGAFNVLYKEEFMVNKVGVNTVYASRAFQVPNNAAMGFLIKPGVKMIIPYHRRYPDCINIYSYTLNNGNIDIQEGKQTNLQRLNYQCRKYSLSIMVRVEERKLDETCASNSECVTSNSYCYGSKCVCKSGYFSHNGECPKKVTIGNTCEVNAACSTAYTECKNEKCSCVSTHKEENGKCIRTATEMKGPELIARSNLDADTTQLVTVVPSAWDYRFGKAGTALRIKFYGQKAGQVGVMIVKKGYHYMDWWSSNNDHMNFKVLFLKNVTVTKAGVYTVDIPNGVRIGISDTVAFYGKTGVIPYDTYKGCYLYVARNKKEVTPTLDKTIEVVQKFGECRKYSLAAEIRFD